MYAQARDGKLSREAASLKTLLQQHGYKVAHHPLWASVTDVVPPPLVIISRLAKSLDVELPFIRTGYDSSATFRHELKAVVSWYTRPRSVHPTADGCTLATIARALGSRLRSQGTSTGEDIGAGAAVGAHGGESAPFVVSTSGGACDTSLVRDALEHCSHEVVLDALVNNQIVAKLLPSAPRGGSIRMPDEPSHLHAPFPCIACSRHRRGSWIHGVFSRRRCDCTGTNSCESTHSYFRSMVGAVPRSIDTLETVLALTRLGYTYTRASRPMLGKRLDGDTLLAGIAATTARLLDSALHDASLARKFDCWRPKVRECNFRVMHLVWLASLDSVASCAIKMG